MTFFRRIPILCLALLLAIGSMMPSVVKAARGSQEAPRLLNLWFTWQLPDETLVELAKWDVVVLDMDQQARFPDRIRRLRQLNPNIKVLAYVDSCNIATARFVEESWFPGYKLAHAIPESFYMHRGSSRVSIWPGAWMLNVTSNGPTDAQGRRWSDMLPEFIQQEVWSTGLWDGIFLDNALDNATYFAGKGLDITGDGQGENDAAVDAAWKIGWQQLAQNLRSRLGPNALIMGNGSVQHAGVVNGILLENFPRYGWAAGFRDSETSLSKNARPRLTALNSNPNNANAPQSWQLMRYTLTSALLGDGYYSFDYGDRDHGQAWWYDEYDAILGRPTGPARIIQPAGASGFRTGVWWRDYERGAVVVNSTVNAATVDLPGPFERLRGTQDTGVNSGRVETAVRLAAQDGLILYRRGDAATIGESTAYRNGDFLRVYRPDGSQPRGAFFAQRAGAVGGAVVLSRDIDQDGTSDQLTATNGELRIVYGNGQARTLRPFGNAYRGAITFAVGNLDRDAPLELAVANATAELRLIERDGVVRATWRPYATFRGSVSLGIGDLDGDGLREIVTGAGPGGGPHIRTWKTDGKSWGGSYFAFDPNERGGVSVAVGDLDADGKDEIITGSGRGSIPRLRQYNATAERIREITLSSQPSAGGVNVTLTDFDGDRQLEILASGITVAP